MQALTYENVLQLLRTGTAAERQALVRSLPSAPLRDDAAALVASENAGMVVIALASLLPLYCNGMNPAVGGILASAVHERAREIVDHVPDHGLLPATLSGLAHAHLKSLSLLGRNEELLQAAERYVALYREEPDNLPGIRTLRVEALVNLERFDDAAVVLEQSSDLLGHPICGMEVRRLSGLVEQARRSVFHLPSAEPPRVPPADRGELLRALQHAVALGARSGDPSARLPGIEQLAGSRSLDPEDPADFAQLQAILDRGESLLSRNAADSEMTVAGKIRRATAIFVRQTPPRDRILQSLDELNQARAWAVQHRVRTLENDANWGMYLCHGRLGDSSSAADALIRLRDGLESRRSGIRDPLERAGVFGQYRYLFHALCEQLSRADRTADLLQAIESSKGRAIADRLTQEGHDIVADRSMYESVARLPALAREHAFHYLSCFVDDERTYAVLVDKHGQLHAAPAIALSARRIRAAARAVQPTRWGRLSASLGKIPRTDQELAPMVAWLDRLVDEGLLSKGDHLVFCPDDSLCNVPLHYLAFRDGILLQWFSTSKVHSAALLESALRGGHRMPPDAFVAFVVPTRQDLEAPGGERTLAAFEGPATWLAAHRPGGIVSREQATLHALAGTALTRRVVHFSTHGWFPPDGNPYTDSYLLMAGPGGLPDRDAAASGGEEDAKLTPRLTVERKFDATGSHVSTMACLSGLAREGIAGDALGMDWAFLHAGASALVSSHWAVDAAASSRFFQLFYDRWLVQGRSRAQAIREAALELLGGDFSPSSLEQWAAFSLTGDFR